MMYDGTNEGTKMPRLSVRRIDIITEPGMYGDGGGLYLRVGPTGSKSWVLRTVVFGRRRDLGLGSASLVSLAEARDAAHALRKVARAGGDPDAVRKRETLTFGEAAQRVHDSLLPTWRSKRHGEIWMGALKRYAFPLLEDRPIETVSTSDILNVVAPIWTAKNDTANRVKQRLSAIFDWAKAAGHYRAENPVNGLKRALPSVRPQVVHMASLPWQDLPKFVQDVRARDGISSRALEFLILTAARSGEVRGAEWAEIEADIWAIPAGRMKSGRLHRVPLGNRALEILDSMRGLDPRLIFPSPNRDGNNQGREMSDTVFKALMDRMGRKGITTHGFRSTFRDWSSESAHVDRVVAEAALSHAVADKVERAYARSDLFERRKQLMFLWEDFSSGRSGQVVRIGQRR